METKEFDFRGLALNGFLMLFVNFAVLVLTIVGIVLSIIQLDASDGAPGRMVAWKLCSLADYKYNNVVRSHGAGVKRGSRNNMVW